MISTELYKNPREHRTTTEKASGLDLRIGRVQTAFDDANAAEKMPAIASRVEQLNAPDAKAPASLRWHELAPHVAK